MERSDMENSLSRMRPHLVSEWSEKNFPLTPDTVTFGSNKTVWWKGLAVTNGRQALKLAPQASNVQYVRERGCFKVITTLKVSFLILRRNGRPRMSR